MALVVISIIECFLYYICILSISVKLLEAKYNKIKMGVSFLFFIPIIVIGVLCDNNTIILTLGIFQILEILLARFCLHNVRITSIIYFYIFLFFTNTIIISCVIYFLSVKSNKEWIIELAVNLTSMIICLIVCHTNLNYKVRQMLIWIPKSIKRLLLSLLISCSILVVLILNASFYKDNQNWSEAVRIVLIILIIFLSLATPILIIYSMTNTHLKKLTDNYEKQINAQSEHYALLSELNYELRRFRHDCNNLRIGISKLISDGDNEAALEMLDCISLKDKSLIKFDTGNGIVDALLTDKQKLADKINTQIEFNGAVPPTGIKPTELCVIFGNTIDNALEACKKIVSSYIKVIYVDCVCNSGFMFIKISNPVVQKVEILEKIPSTTKKDKSKHGFGLYSLEQVVKQHSGKISFECDENKFQVDIELSLIF